MKQWINITDETLPRDVVHPLQTDKGLAYYMDHNNQWWLAKGGGQIHPTKYMSGDPATFTLDDIINAYKYGHLEGLNGQAPQYRGPLKQYLKTHHNIEL